MPVKTDGKDNIPPTAPRQFGSSLLLWLAVLIFFNLFLIWTTPLSTSSLPPNQMGWVVTLLSWVLPPLIFQGIWGWLINRC